MKLYELLNMSIGNFNVQIDYGDRTIYDEVKGDNNREEILNRIGNEEVLDINFYITWKQLVIKI